MKNIIKKYNKNKKISNTKLILTSLVLAFWINFLLIDWTSIWKNIKTSVLNSNIEINTSDISIINKDNSLLIISNKKITNLKNLSFSILYNPDNVSIESIKSDLWDIINLSNTKWINSVILSSENWVNIEKWNIITIINAQKKTNISENINIINANFKDIDSEQYFLSTSWITF